MAAGGTTASPRREEFVFLGLAKRARPHQVGQTPVVEWDILGLSSVAFVSFFPASIQGFNLGFAFRGQPSANAKLSIRLPDGRDIGHIQFEASVSSPGDARVSIDGEVPIHSLGDEGWSVLFAHVTANDIVFDRASRCSVVQHYDDGTVQPVGSFSLVLVDPPPLTVEKREALRANPDAVKAARIILGCKKCPSQFRCYAAHDRDASSELEGWHWYEQIPDQFRCACGETQIDLSSIRRNFFAALEWRPSATGTLLNFDRLYEKNALGSLRHEFRSLLNANPKEETLQKFVERNPILLHQFAAERLFFKPSILNFFKADFAVLTSAKKLLLIEIESAGTRLLTKSGNDSSALVHAFNQVDNWLHVVDEHRLAVLDGLDIDRDLVSSVEGVVIAGRDSSYDSKHLRRLKGVNRGRVRFLTFDDLVASIGTLIGGMESL